MVLPVILHLEDSEDDAFLLEKALEQEGIVVYVHRVADGKEGMRYLQGEGVYSDRKAYPFPQFILTDLNMPVMDGFNFLNWLKEDRLSNLVPAMVLSACQSTEEIERAYRLGAIAYFVKPSTLSGLQEVVRAAHAIWTHS